MAPTGELAKWYCVITDTVRDYPEFTFTIDTHYRRDGARMYFAHIEFHKFSPAIFKRVIKEWREFRPTIDAPILAVRDDGDERKWHHYVTACGFKPTGTFIKTNAGPLREVYIHNGNLHTTVPIFDGSVATSTIVS